MILRCDSVRMISKRTRERLEMGSSISQVDWISCKRVRQRFDSTKHISTLHPVIFRSSRSIAWFLFQLIRKDNWKLEICFCFVVLKSRVLRSATLSKKEELESKTGNNSFLRPTLTSVCSRSLVPIHFSYFIPNEHTRNNVKRMHRECEACWNIFTLECNNIRNPWNETWLGLDPIRRDRWFSVVARSLKLDGSVWASRISSQQEAMPTCRVAQFSLWLVAYLRASSIPSSCPLHLALHPI